MDFSKIDTSAVNAGSKMTVLDVNGVPLLKPDKSPITITLRGKDSDAYIAHENQATNRRLQQGARVKLTSEGLKADVIAGLAKCTVAWDGIGIGEDETACSYEAAVRLYTLAPDIKDQVAAFVEDRANFLKPSPTN